MHSIGWSIGKQHCIIIIIRLRQFLPGPEVVYLLRTVHYMYVDAGQRDNTTDRDVQYMCCMYSVRRTEFGVRALLQYLHVCTCRVVLRTALVCYTTWEDLISSPSMDHTHTFELTLPLHLMSPVQRSRTLRPR